MLSFVVIIYCLTTNVFSADFTSSDSNDFPNKCDENDADCLKEKLNFEAIEVIHRQIDEDHDGVVELSETKDFFKDELNMTDSDRKSSHFHLKDSSISLSEFWVLWKSSEAHNWTESQVLDWLIEHVQLGKYAYIFQKFGISGRDIPRLATNISFKSKILGITDPIARKRLQIMALDVVLFGAPSQKNHFLNDFLIVMSILVGISGIYFAFKQNYKLERERLLVKELEDKIENNLNELESLSVLRKSDSDDNIMNEYDYSKMDASLKGPLQSLLSRTYEVETRYVNLMKQKNNYLVLGLRDQMNKLNRKRASSLLSAIKYGYSNSFSELDDKIIDARKSTTEFNNYFREFKQRWRDIERLSGVSVVKNGNNSEKKEHDDEFSMATSGDDSVLKDKKGGLFRKKKKN